MHATSIHTLKIPTELNIVLAKFCGSSANAWIKQH